MFSVPFCAAVCSDGLRSVVGAQQADKHGLFLREPRTTDRNSTDSAGKLIRGGES